MITHDNYFSVETDREYMSNSQYGRWLRCAAAEKARQAGEWSYTPTSAMLIGSYVDTVLTGGDLEAFKLDHPEIMKAQKVGTLTNLVDDAVTICGRAKKQLEAVGVMMTIPQPFTASEAGTDSTVFAALEKKGLIETSERLTLKSEFAKSGDAMIEAVKKRPDMYGQLIGPNIQNQVIMTGDIAGLKWRCMVDAIDVNDDPRINDLKTTRNIHELTWSEQHNARVPFWEVFGYWKQGTIYRELARQTYRGMIFDYNIIAVSSETPPDVAGIAFRGAGRFQAELEQINLNAPYVQRMKEGKEHAPMCGKCAYCRENKPFEWMGTDYE